MTAELERRDRGHLQRGTLLGNFQYEEVFSAAQNRKCNRKNSAHFLVIIFGSRYHQESLSDFIQEEDYFGLSIRSETVRNDAIYFLRKTCTNSSCEYAVGQSETRRIRF